MEKVHETNIRYLKNLLTENKFSWVNYEVPIDIVFFKSGGGTHLYLIVNANKKFVARINYYSPKNDWGVKKQEYDVLKIIEPLKISPRVYFFNNENSIKQDLTIVEFIEGEPLSEVTDQIITFLAQDLLKLHSAFSYTRPGDSIPPTDNLPYHCDIYNEFANGEDKKIEKYLDFANIDTVIQPFNRINKALGDWFSNLSVFDSAINFCLCHADLKKENILVTHDGVMLIDWECAGSDIPETDIGRLFSGCQLSNKQQGIFLKSYYGKIPDSTTLQKINAVKMVLDFFRIIEDYLILKRKPWSADGMLVDLYNFEQKLKEIVKV